MELIISFCSVIGAFVGTLAAHFVAHDAYSQCPKYARRIIERAAKMLPAWERARYEEEWLADLNDRLGVFPKFKHAIECLLCARTLRRIAERHREPTIQVEIRGLGEMEVDFASGAQALLAMLKMDVKRAAQRGREDASQIQQKFQSLQADIYQMVGQGDPQEILRLADFVEGAREPFELIWKCRGRVMHTMRIGRHSPTDGVIAKDGGGVR